MALTKQEHSHTGLHQPKWHHTTFTKQFKLSVTTIVSEDGPALAFKILLPMLFVCRIISLDLIFWEVLCSKNQYAGRMSSASGFNVEARFHNASSYRENSWMNVNFEINPYYLILEMVFHLSITSMSGCA